MENFYEDNINKIIEGLTVVRSRSQDIGKIAGIINNIERYKDIKPVLGYAYVIGLGRLSRLGFTDKGSFEAFIKSDIEALTKRKTKKNSRYTKSKEATLKDIYYQLDWKMYLEINGNYYFKLPLYTIGGSK